MRHVAKVKKRHGTFLKKKIVLYSLVMSHADLDCMGQAWSITSSEARASRGGLKSQC